MVRRSPGQPGAEPVAANPPPASWRPGDDHDHSHTSLGLVQARAANNRLPLTCGLLNWIADALCLAVAIQAMGAPIPWGRLLLVWSAGGAAASLAPTPFGLGVVDIALISALVGSGLRSPDAVGAVILYRIITFKILVTLVWIGYRYIHRARERARSGARCADH